MTKKSFLFGILFFTVFLQLAVLFQNCSNLVPAGNNGNNGISTGISVTPASLNQCPTGGNTYTVFQDNNNTGVFGPGDNVISNQTICNGTNGLSTLLSTQRVTTGLEACASGSGLQLNSGLDINGDGVLQPSEITQTQVVCDGQNGAVGAAGPAGSNGYGVVFQIVPAPSAACPSGGSLILMAQDTQRTGTYSALNANQQSVIICNGNPAPVSSYLPIQPIMPCGNTVAYKEVLLRLSNGQILAAFSDNVSGLNTRLSLLPDGQYMDTDDSQCVFSISTNSSAQTRSISWSGHVQLTWPLSNSSN